MIIHRLLFTDNYLDNQRYSSFDAIKKVRLEKGKPIVEGFLSWLDQQSPIRGSRMDKAVTYIQNRRSYLSTYLEDGRCSFSNNLSENAIRPFTVGRKNWLFCDTPNGAQASAIVYTMVEMAKANGVNVYHYENEIRNNAYIDKYEYGILICRKKNLNTVNEDMILNSGIIVERASLSEIFGENMRISKYIFNSYERERAYNDIIVNFPSNWLQLDVARDNITDFSDIINDNGGADLLGEKIAESLYKQIVQELRRNILL